MLAVSWIFVRSHAEPRRPAVPPPAARVRRRSTASATAATTRRRPIGIIWMLLIAARLHAAQDDSLPAWVVDRLLHRDRPGHDVRRLAHRQDDGPAHHQDPPGRRLLRRDWRARSRCSSPPRSAFRCRRRTPSPARSSASARRRRCRAVRWGLAGNIVWAWVLTIPCSAFIAGARVVARATILLALAGASCAGAPPPVAGAPAARSSFRRPSRSAASSGTLSPSLSGALIFTSMRCEPPGLSSSAPFAGTS